MLVDIINEQVKSAEIHLIIVNNTIDPDLLKSVSKQAKIHRINRHPKTWSIFRMVYLNFLTAIIKPDVIHCHAPTLIRFLIFRHLLKHKTVLTIHSIITSYKELAEYDQLIAISEAVKKAVTNNSDLLVKTICNGVILWKGQEKKDDSNRRFKIVQVGRLEHLIKGQHILIDALEALVNKDPEQNITIDFIGSGGSDRILKEQSSRLGLDNHIRFLGSKNKNDIYALLKGYHLLVHPSLVEGFGLPIAEAMTTRMPVLVSNIEATMEIINGGSLGYFFETNNYQDCAEKIKKIREEYGSSEQKEILEKAYVYVEQNFNVQVTAKKYLDEYERQMK